MNLATRSGAATISRKNPSTESRTFFSETVLLFGQIEGPRLRWTLHPRFWYVAAFFLTRLTTAIEPPHLPHRRSPASRDGSRVDPGGRPIFLAIVRRNCCW